MPRDLKSLVIWKSKRTLQKTTVKPLILGKSFMILKVG